MMSSTNDSASSARIEVEVVGLIPGAGLAKRLQPFPCSKELFPVGFGIDKITGMPRPKVAAQYLLEKFSAAGITTVYVVIRDGKWDIPNYFRDGGFLGLSLAYVVIPGSVGPPDTIDRAYAFIEHKRVAFGFPDIIFGPDDAYRQLIDKLTQTGTEVVLGLHRVYDPLAWDMVDCEADGRVRAIVMKPASTTLTYGWCCAVWTPAFSAFLHRFLRAEETLRNLSDLRSTANDPGGDLAMGVVLQAALKEGFPMQTVLFPYDTYLDIGTPNNLVKAVRRFCPPE